MLLLRKETIFKKVLRAGKMSESILQAILANTTETRNQLDKVQDGLARIEVLTQQNSSSIEHLDKIVWKSVGESPTLLQSYADQNAKIQNLTYTIGKLEKDLRTDIEGISSKIDNKNQFIQTAILSVLMLVLGGFVTFVYDTHNR